MNRFLGTIVSAFTVALVSLATPQSVHAGTFTLTSITNTTPTFPSTILINGTVTMASGETMYSPNQISTHNLPFLSTFLAGFNGSGQGFDATFLAWNGLGTYAGAILNHQISTNNLGYAAGMPVGLYGFNPLGPGGQASVTLNYIGTDGLTHAMVSTYAINVVPSPSAAALLGIGGLVATRRRRA